MHENVGRHGGFFGTIGILIKLTQHIPANLPRNMVKPPASPAQALGEVTHCGGIQYPNPVTSSHVLMMYGIWYIFVCVCVCVCCDMRPEMAVESQQIWSFKRETRWKRPFWTPDQPSFIHFPVSAAHTASHLAQPPSFGMRRRLHVLFHLLLSTVV